MTQLRELTGNNLAVDTAELEAGDVDRIAELTGLEADRIGIALSLVHSIEQSAGCLPDVVMDEPLGGQSALGRVALAARVVLREKGLV